MIGIIYMVIGLVCAFFHLKSQRCRIDSIELLGAALVFMGWPFWCVGRTIMRLFNGDWQ